MHNINAIGLLLYITALAWDGVMRWPMAWARRKWYNIQLET
jgi:hypothetical protein